LAAILVIDADVAIAIFLTLNMNSQSRHHSGHLVAREKLDPARWHRDTFNIGLQIDLLPLFRGM